jgi:hypothetical protein
MAWYVHRDGEQEGPFTWERLWQEARSGRIRPEDRVWREGTTDWSPADRVPGLIHVPSAAVTPPPPPIDAPSPPPIPPPSVERPSQATPVKSGPWRLVAAILGAVVILAGGCGAAYLFLLRDAILPASQSDATAEPLTTVLPTAGAIYSAPTTAGSDERTQAPATDVETATPLPPSPTPTPRLVETTEPIPEPTPDASAEIEVPTNEPPTEAPDPGEVNQPGLPSPGDVVDEFIRVTLGTVPGAALDYDRARALMTVAYAGAFDSPAFIPQTYGIQDGPTSYELASEAVSGSTATVLVLGTWGADLEQAWRFTLQEEAGLWRVAAIEPLDAQEPDAPDDASSPFWQLNPVVEEFTVYDHGGWKLVVAFDQPAEDITVDFQIAYRRVDDGTLVYSQEQSGVIEAGRVRLTLDSDWTGYDLSQLGFQRGRHRVIAIFDGVEIAAGDLTVD